MYIISPYIHNMIVKGKEVFVSFIKMCIQLNKTIPTTTPAISDIFLMMHDYRISNNNNQSFSIQ